MDARGKACSIAFVISIIDELDHYAALPSLTQFTSELYLPAYLSACPLRPSALITIAGFTDGQATSTG
jgi:hypothetical protein